MYNTQYLYKKMLLNKNNAIYMCLRNIAIITVNVQEGTFL